MILKREEETGEIPGFGFVDIDIRDGVKSKGLPTDLSPEVVKHKLFVRRVETEPRSKRVRRITTDGSHQEIRVLIEAEIETSESGIAIGIGTGTERGVRVRVED